MVKCCTGGQGQREVEEEENCTLTELTDTIFKVNLCVCTRAPYLTDSAQFFNMIDIINCLNMINCKVYVRVRLFNFIHFPAKLGFQLSGHSSRVH